MIHTVLSVAGSDPSGGAGIQADLKTFSSLKVYGMAVIAALTAQNTVGVTAIMPIPGEFVGLQLDSVMTDVNPDAIKTGMLANADIVDVVAGRIRQYGAARLVVDPVIVSTSGRMLLEPRAVDVLKRQLLPLALLLTPNLQEASALTGVAVHDRAAMEDAARRLHDLGARNVLVKGGHLDGDALDVFFDGQTMEQFREARIETRDLHGTGCVLSAAIAAYLASGCAILDAVRFGKQFVTGAIRRSLRLGGGSGPIDAADVNRD